MKRIGVVFALTMLLAVGVASAQAVSNTGTGDIAGDATAITASDPFNLTTSTLKLVKTAFLANNTPLASGATVPKGTVVKFMVYVNNNTAIPVTNLSLRDVLDPAFRYEGGTIRTDNSASCTALLCTPAEEAAIRAAVDVPANNRTDAVDPDVASYTIATTTVDVGATAGNGQLDIAANKVFAVLFQVTVR